MRFEQEPNNGEILGNIFRLVHTIKGTCGFLSLPRLEVLAHAAEGMMGQFRDGLPVTTEAVTLVLSTIDRIKSILDAIEMSGQEPAGDDVDLIGELNRLTAAQTDDAARAAQPTPFRGDPQRSPTEKRPHSSPGQRGPRPSASRMSAATGSPTNPSASMSRRSTIS